MVFEYNQEKTQYYTFKGVLLQPDKSYLISYKKKYIE